MRKITIRKIVSCILTVALLATTFLIPANAAVNTDAITEENTKSYLVGDGQSFNGTVANRYDLPAEDMEFFDGNGSATWTATFNTTSTNLQAIMGIYSASQDNNYIAVYITGGNKVGIEIRNTSKNTAFSQTVTNSFSDGQDHTITFTIKENEYYKFYLDGTCIWSNASTSTVFVNTLGVEDFTNGAIGATNRPTQSGWSFNGTIKDVYMSNIALDETEILKFHGIYPTEVVAETTVKDTTGTEPTIVTEDFNLDTLKAMDQGSINVNYKRDSVLANDLQSFLAFSNSDGENDYATFYVNKAGTRVGFEFRTAAVNAHTFWDGLSLGDTNWHNLGFVFDGANVTLYVDGVSKGAKSFTGMLGSLTWIDSLNTVSLGGMVRNESKTGANNQWFGDYNVNSVTVYSNVMSASQMASIQSGTGSASVSENQVSNRTALFYSGYEDSANYRIPAMVTAQDGTIVAAIDQRKTTSADYGDIDLMVRRSTDGGETWGDPIMLTNLPSGGSQHSFIIDSELLVAGDGTIYCLVDMFPESLALMDYNSLKAGSGYKEVDGKKYMILYDADSNEYTLRDNGVVYTPEGEVSDYKVTDFGTGTLVKTVDGEEQAAGSIFLYSGANAGELSVLKTSYLWLLKSTDNGLTWSDPVDITGMVKADWMIFCGTGPGRGTTTTIDGKERLIFSIYHTNNVGGLSTQASATIYSDDGGVTWTRGQAAVEALGQDPSTASSLTQLTENQVIDLGNGNVVMFSRNYSGHAYMSISTDGGATWDSCAPNNAVYDCYCQMSAIVHEYQGKKYLVISNPNAGGRNNMTIRVTDITDGTISTDSADWSYTTINVGHDQYSCLTSIDENTIGILYETDTTWHALDMLFQKFDFAYLLQGNGGDISKVPEYPEITGITAEVINGENGTEGYTEVGDTIRVKATLGVPVFVTGEAAIALQYETAEGTKTVYANYVSGSGTKEICFDYVIEESFKGDIYAVIAPIANLESSTGRGVSSLRNGERVSVASYGVSASDSSFDLAVSGATAGSFHSGEGPDKAIDKNTTTMWHSEWASGNNRPDLWITLDLGEVKEVSGVRYLPRQSQTNGIITEYEILVSTDGTEFTSVAAGEWAADNTWKKAEFDNVQARYVKLVAVDSISTEIGNTYASAAEVAVYYLPEADNTPELEAALEAAKAKDQAIAEAATVLWYSEDIEALKAVISEAEALLENTEATNAMRTEMIAKLEAAMAVRAQSGDANSDGKISVVDATLIQLYSANKLGETTTIDLAASDTNGDSDVNVNDATLIQKYIAGISNAGELAPYYPVLA